jgi:hypothetical protein
MSPQHQPSWKQEVRQEQSPAGTPEKPESGTPGPEGEKH